MKNRIQTILNTGRLHHCKACNTHYLPFKDDSLACPVCGQGKEMEMFINDLNDDFDGTIEELVLPDLKLTKKERGQWLASRMVDFKDEE